MTNLNPHPRIARAWRSARWWSSYAVCARAIREASPDPPVDIDEISRPTPADMPRQRDRDG